MLRDLEAGELWELWKHDRQVLQMVSATLPGVELVWPLVVVVEFNRKTQNALVGVLDPGWAAWKAGELHRLGNYVFREGFCSARLAW